MATAFEIKRGDTLTKHVATLKENGVVIDLTNFAVVACFKIGSTKFTRTYVKQSPATGGIVEYTMLAADYTGDFLKNGTYQVEFTLTDGAGDVKRVPNVGTATFTIYGSVCA